MSEYTIYDGNKERAPVLTRDAARPFVVVRNFYAGYKSGMRNEIIGHYATRKAAQQAIRRHQDK